ncbi:MAG: hypothetical protein VKN17_01500 [Cyanobacteriota bacterium]|jgi:hypothetical protein|nr:hypothetical protein [Synechococcus sp. FGCU3]MEB3104437.1 hypothetical protein [Cyanobacteriota bacterium]
MDHCTQPWSLPPEGFRRLLELCWQHECDLDPMILRARLLRHQGNRLQAASVEQELLPLF